MTTLTDLGVTQAKLRAYGQDGKFEALTGPQLQGVCCYLKAHFDKREGKYKRWSKSVAKEMRSIGITQDQRSGEPCINYRKAKVVENISVSLEDFNRVEDELKAAQAELEAFKDEGTPTGETVLVKGIGEVEVVSTNPISGSEDLMKANKLVKPDECAASMVKDALALKPNRTRRTKAQIEADKLKEAE